MAQFESRAVHASTAHKQRLQTAYGLRQRTTTNKNIGFNCAALQLQVQLGLLTQYYIII